MGVLDRLFGKKKEQAQQPPDEPPHECIHGVLVPHWDGVDDIGKDDRVVWYRCQSCHAIFSREEGERLIAEVADRLTTSESGVAKGLRQA